MKKECKFCSAERIKENERFLIKDYKYWRLYIGLSHQCIGWCDVILKRHIEFFENLESKELSELQKVISEWKGALAKLFRPNWFNVMQLGNSTKHLHFLIVPRYNHKVKYRGRIFIDKDYGHMLQERFKLEKPEFLEQLARDIRRKIKK